MNRIFYVLLFLTISGFGVLWWLLNSLPPDEEAAVSKENPGLVIHDEKKDEKSTAQTAAAAAKDEAKTEAEKIPVKTSEEVPAVDALKEDSEAKAAEVPAVAAKSPAVKEGKSSLFIDSTPAGAMVYLDGVLKGKTPFSFGLLPSDKVVRVELAGFERQERTIDDPIHTSGSLTRWKFDLKEQTAVAKEANFQKTDYRLTGARGPFFIQLKAVDSKQNTGWLVAVQSFREKLKNPSIFICEVDLPGKGKWTRFLEGPYNSKAEAQGLLKQAKELSGEKDSFVVGDQTCLE